MNDKTLQKKIEQFAKLGNELDEEAKNRYGRGACLYIEADGSVLILGSESINRTEWAYHDEDVKWSSNTTITWSGGGR